MLEASDIIQIHELISLYGHIIDDREYSRIEELFTEESIYDVSAISGRVFTGTEAIRALWLEVEDVHPLAHHATNVLVREAPDGTVHVRSKGIGVRKDGQTGSVMYDDIVGRTPDGWRILKRVAWRRDPNKIPQPS
jgi:hypothetical protein